jgi:CheY-like chemotaxis protein
MNKEKFKILIVEDDLLIAKYLKMELETLCYEVAISKNGLKAIDYIVNNKSECDLILMDINLGDGIDGFHSAIEINKFKEIPVLFLSACVDIHCIDKARGANSYGFLLKHSGISVISFNIQSAISQFIQKKKNDEILNEINEFSNINQLFVNVTTLFLENSDFRRELITFDA